MKPCIKEHPIFDNHCKICELYEYDPHYRELWDKKVPTVEKRVIDPNKPRIPKGQTDCIPCKEKRDTFPDNVMKNYGPEIYSEDRLVIRFDNKIDREDIYIDLSEYPTVYIKRMGSTVKIPNVKNKVLGMDFPSLPFPVKEAV